MAAGGDPVIPDGSPAPVRPVRLVPGPDIEAWDDREVEAYARAALRDGVPAPTSLAIEANAPRVLRAFGRFWWATVRRGSLGPALVERLRVRMAEASGCLYCATSSLDIARLAPPVTPTTAANDRDALATEAADRLATDPASLGARLREAIIAAFDPGELAELLAFLAWQSGGPRAIRAWGAEAYKPGARVDESRLPVPLPYASRSGVVPEPPEPRSVDVEAVLARAARTGWPPPPWVRLLAPRPAILATWLGLVEATTTGDPLGDRVGMLVRLAIGAAVGVPGFMPPDIPAVAAAGLGPEEARAVAAGDAMSLVPAERLAIEWARSLAIRGEVPDHLRVAALDTLGDAAVVQLGFAVATIAGPARVQRWFAGTPAGVIQLLDQAGS